MTGTNLSGNGVFGQSQAVNAFGVCGINTAGVGVRGDSEDHDGVQGFANNTDKAGVVGTHLGSGVGVRGQSVFGTGVHAASENSIGLEASGSIAARLVGKPSSKATSTSPVTCSCLVPTMRRRSARPTSRCEKASS
ncbi:hypothetical protein [Mycobacterium sp.]|uniref:hypothetical protein n=1 Tax=Mycobacterium sp. TaxID=1785 RepID=UPI003C75EF14